MALLALAIPTAIATTSQPAAERFRMVRGTVQGMDGKPAAGCTVHLIGLSRYSMSPLEEGQSDAYWKFTTDSAGHFFVRIGEFETSDDKLGRPGWGEYALVVERSDQSAGAVSHLFMNDKVAPRSDHAYSDYTDEWGSPEDLPSKGLDLVLRMRRGVTLRGRVVDYATPSRGLAGIPISAGSDLHANTHTGYGAEIFVQETKTNAEGRFTLFHLYPTRFYLSLSDGHFVSRVPSSGELTWLKTKVDHGDWKNDAHDALAPRAGEKAMHIEIMATNQRLFRYHGRVTTSTGAPVAGAEVALNTSFHEDEDSFLDSHAFERTTSQSDGTYELMLRTPWVGGITINASTFQLMELWDPEDRAGLRPGERNFVLSPLPASSRSPKATPTSGG